MASIIDNKKKTMLESLKNALKQAERVDIITAFFYFSGFEELADDLRDKKIRILVGNTIDPEAISELCKAVKDNESEDLSVYGKRNYTSMNGLQKKNLYIESFVNMFNKSTLSSKFDSTVNQSIFKMFLEKLNNGTLEIRLTAKPNHSKAYIMTNKFEYSCFGDQKGVVITGSSNFTYNGLLGQGEINERFSDNDKYEEYSNHFEELWKDGNAIDISTKDSNHDFLDEIEKRLWIFAKPLPYHIYIRILHELYSDTYNAVIKMPSEISNGKYSNFKYQVDAIKRGIDCINKNNGVIIADVVGLGKSIIASAIANNLDIKRTVIICPPHLVEQWEEYEQDFGLRGVKVCSSGKLEELYNTYASDSNPILYIIDEAHRYRNELGTSYQWLHQLTRSNAQNKVILLTATPYNNRPQDLFALIKLFQTPSRSTISSVDNLSVRFHELIAKYNRLEKDGKRHITPEIKQELESISAQLRNIIAPVLIRRSRIDLQEIKEYDEDLRLQRISFPEVVGPTLVEYDLGEIRDLYLDTLEELSNKFICARYNPSAYLINPAMFMEKYGELFEQANIQLFQKNLAEFMKRLLVMRFESSKAAFKETLNSIIASYQNIKKWWEKGYVPIKKRGYLPEPDDSDIDEIMKEIDNLIDEEFDINKIKKKAIPFSKELFKEDYIHAIDSDIELLTRIRDDWFATDEIGFDPKYNEIKNNIDKLLNENRNRKITVFSTYADTANYVKTRLENDGYRVLLYTGKGQKIDRAIVRKNFDASCRLQDQRDDFDIIIATDALSEGFNLNRAGVIINYDIPYNPTRVVQRIGRINRINKKMFDKIYIYNFFPTDIGEQNTLIKGISTLKMLLINNIVGSDTRTLTPNETLQSYFKNVYDEADDVSNTRSWDNEYVNTYNAVKHNITLLNKVLCIPERARIVRKNNKKNCAISFAKRGNNALFAIAQSYSPTAVLVSAEQVLPLFKAVIDEPAYEFDSKLDVKFKILCDEICKPYPKIKMEGRRSKAVATIQMLMDIYPKEKDYLGALLEVIRTYDDLSGGELKFLSKLIIKKSELDETIRELKQYIPPHYIIQIKEKAEQIDSLNEIIMFTEDLRSDND